MVQLIKNIFPDRCLRCGQPVEKVSLCAGCAAGVRAFPAATCSVCGRELSSGDICIACSVKKPPYDRVFSATVYDGTVKEMLQQFKYQRQTGYKRFLGELLYDSLPRDDISIDILTFVPLHWTRQIARGYNQAALLAREIARKEGVRVHYDVLRKVRRTPAQVGLELRQRAKNLNRAFEARDVEGKRVMVIDDVITSGSTALAVAAALKKAGADWVMVASVARVLS